MKIAVYSISLNEIKHVDRYMQACQGADYIIVADTGSTDGTPERLKELGATVHSITIKPWRFDDARNAALALVIDPASIVLVTEPVSVMSIPLVTVPAFPSMLTPVNV